MILSNCKQTTGLSNQRVNRFQDEAHISGRGTGLTGNSVNKL